MVIARLPLLMALLVSQLLCVVHAQTHSAATLVAQIPEIQRVLVLNETTFPAAVQTYDPLFVLFDSSARYGSLTLSRRFADAAQAVRQYNWDPRFTALRFASLDVRQLTHTLPVELHVVGLPALLRFRCPTPNDSFDPSLVAVANCSMRNGGIDVYTGGRTSMEFQRYILNQPQREPVAIATREQLHVLIKTRPFVALFVVDGDDSQAFLDCRVLAQIDDDSSVYAVTTNALLFEQDRAHGTIVDDGAAEDEQLLYLDLQLTGVPALVLFREFGNERVVYTGDWNKAALAQFIQKKRYNLVSTYTSRGSRYFYDRSAVAHVLLFSDHQAPYHRTLVSEIQDIAAQYYAGKYVLRFVVVPRDKETLKHALFVMDDQFPTVLLVQDVSQAPTRLPFHGDEMIALLHDGVFAQALSDELVLYFPPFATSELPDDEGDLDGDGIQDDDGDGVVVDPHAPPNEETLDWRDYSDLFETRHVPGTSSAGLRPVFTATTTQFQPPGTMARRLVEANGDVSSSSADTFLSIFGTSEAAASSGPQVIEITDKEQLQDLWPRGDSRFLVFIHSHLCYACRQAKPVLDALVAALPAASSAIQMVVTVDVDRVGEYDWPQRYEWLPGIFVLSAPRHVTAFPSRTEVTLESLLAFISSSTIANTTTTIL